MIKESLKGEKKIKEDPKLGGVIRRCVLTALPLKVKMRYKRPKT